MKISDFKVGETAYTLIEEGRMYREDIQEVKILKVGRKYVTVGEFKEQYEETGMQSDNFLVKHDGCYPMKMLFMSMKDISDYKEKEELKRWLSDTVVWNEIRKFTLNQLRAVKKILEGKNET